MKKPMTKSLIDLLKEEDKIVSKINRVQTIITEYEDIGTIESYIIKKYYNKMYKLDKERDMILNDISNLLGYRR